MEGYMSGVCTGEHASRQLGDFASEVFYGVRGGFWRKNHPRYGRRGGLTHGRRSENELPEASSG